MWHTELLRQVLPLFQGARCSPVGGGWERKRRATSYSLSHTLTPLPGLDSRSRKAKCSQRACRLQPRRRTSIRQPVLRGQVGREIDSINLQVGENKQDNSVGRRKAMRSHDWRVLLSAGRQRFTVKCAVHQGSNTDFWDIKAEKVVWQWRSDWVRTLSFPPWNTEYSYVCVRYRNWE